MCAKEPMSADGIVRLSKIEVYPQYLDEYMKYATEVGEISLRTESGVLTMYAVGEKENPCKVTILETYASHAAYEKHIASEHFQKYKQGTLHMVKSLVLSDQTQLNPANNDYEQDFFNFSIQHFNTQCYGTRKDSTDSRTHPVG